MACNPQMCQNYENQGKLWNCSTLETKKKTGQPNATCGSELGAFAVKDVVPSVWETWMGAKNRAVVM